MHLFFEFVFLVTGYYLRFVICFFRFIRVGYMDVISYCNNLENDRIPPVGVGINQEHSFR